MPKPRRHKATLNEDLLEKLEPELKAWDEENEGRRWFSMWRWVRFAVLSGVAPQVAEDPYLTLWKGMASKQTRRNLELYPRGAAKSFMLKGFAAFLLCEHDAHAWGKLIRIAFCGQTKDFATRSVGSLKRMLETNLFILKEYPQMKPDKNILEKRRGLLTELGFPEDADISKPMWRNNAIRTTVNIEGEIEHGIAMEEPSCWAQGMDQATTGFHMDVIIMDDPVGKATYNSSVKKKSTRATYQDLQMQLMDGMMVILGTRWATDDIHQTILDEFYEGFEVEIWDIWGNSGDDWQRDDFIRQPDGTFEFSGDWSKIKLFSESYGIIQKEVEQGFRFTPEQRRWETLQYIGDKIHSVERSFWSKQMMNRAISDDERIFHDWMFKMVPSHGIPGGLPTYILTDAATGQDNRSSYRVIAAVSVDAGPRYYVRSVEFGRWEPTSFCERMLKMQRRYGARKILMEQVAWIDTFKAAMDLLSKMQGMSPPPVEMVFGRSTISKIERIHKLEPYFCKQAIFFEEGMEDQVFDDRNLWRELKHQFMQVQDKDESDGKIMDIPDCLSDMLAVNRKGHAICRARKLSRSRTAPTAEEAVQGLFREKRENRRAQARGGMFARKSNAKIRKPRAWK